MARSTRCATVVVTPARLFPGLGSGLDDAMRAVAESVPTAVVVNLSVIVPLVALGRLPSPQTTTACPAQPNGGRPLELNDEKTRDGSLVNVTVASVAVDGPALEIP